MNAHTDQWQHDTQSSSVGVGTTRTPPPAIMRPTPSGDTPVAGCEPQIAHTDHRNVDAQMGDVGVGVPRTPPPANAVTMSTFSARVAEYDTLSGAIHFLAESLDDIERLRIATGHRAGQMERGALVGLTGDNLAQARQLEAGLLALETQVVKDLEKAMRKHPLGPWLKTATGVGEKQGARLLAAIGNPYWNARDDRPRRGPAELWAYCGYHVLPASDHARYDAHVALVAGGHPSASTDYQTRDDHVRTVGAGQPSHPGDHHHVDSQRERVAGVAPRRRTGQLANWNTQARTRAWLVAKSCEHQTHGKYRDIYDTYRAAHDADLHKVMCEQCSLCLNCGNKLTRTKKDHLAEYGCDDKRATYAMPGSPLKAGHQQGKALRKVAKAVLKDIYLEAKAWHLREATP